MADRTIKPDDGNDLVLQNNDGSAKIEVNEAQNIVLTGGSTTALTIDSSGNITINGVTDASDAGAGNVGEFTDASASGVTISTSTANMMTLTLTAGDWDIFANSSFNGATALYMITHLVTTSGGTGGTLGKTQQIVDLNTSSGQGQGFMSIRASVNSSTTYYLTASVNSGSGAWYYGYMAARRVR